MTRRPDIDQACGPWPMNNVYQFPVWGWSQTKTEATGQIWNCPHTDGKVTTMPTLYDLQVITLAMIGVNLVLSIANMLLSIRVLSVIRRVYQWQQ